MSSRIVKRIAHPSIILLATLPFLALSAHAESYAEALISNVSFHASSLDGGTASFEILPDLSNPYAVSTDLSTYASDNSPTGYSSDYRSTRQFFDTASATASVSSNTAFATSGSNFISSAATSAGQGYAYSTATTSLWASAENTGIKLLPHTQLTVSYDVLVKATDQGGLYYGSAYESANAYATLSFGRTIGADWAVSGNTASFYVGTNADAKADLFENKGSYAVTISNFSDSTLYTSVNAETSVFEGVAQPVPEPSTYAMMILGIGLLACVVRQKNRNAANA